MSEKKTPETTSSAPWWIIGAAVGVAAATFLATRRAKVRAKLWEADDVLAWCDRAADRLDDILSTDSAAKQSA